jgi:hypothetical protein
MFKFEFALTTRDGQRIENIVIAGRDQPDAERKLLQMYRHSTVDRVRIRDADARQLAGVSVEEILTLVAREG